MATRLAARFINRNPRNMELTGRQKPPTGYQFEQDSKHRQFIYKVELVQGKTHQEARLIHYQDGIVVTASTKEKNISNQLYSKTDTCASMNLGRVLAARCLQSGIHFVKPGVTEEQLERSKHQKEFFAALEREGLQLKELEAVEHGYDNDDRFTWERYPLKSTRQEKLDEL